MEDAKAVISEKEFFDNAFPNILREIKEDSNREYSKEELEEMAEYLKDLESNKEVLVVG